MKTKEELKKAVCAAIDARRDDILAFADSVAAEPELGFKEVKTSEKFAALLKSLGREPRTGVAHTGVIEEYKGAKSEIRVAVMGELDAILVADHPDADKLTGAVHACGHNAQLASVAAIAYALHDTDLMENLDGNIVLMGVPAEEYVEVTYRNKLREEGKLWFLSGKQEFIRLGEFDNIDISVMQHSAVAAPGFRAGATSVCNGFTVKLINYKGKAAHAGAAPFEGVNALNAAMLGLMAVHAQRETFRDEDHIRVHPIITKGGDIVNVVPADVRLESYVRGNTTDAIMNASEKVNRAFQAGGTAVGAECEIIELPGYLPVVQCDDLNDLMYEELKSLVGEDVMKVCPGFGGGSSDQGDVSHLIPSIQSYFAGVDGGLHTKDFCMKDKDLTILTAAKAMLCLVIELLYDDASAGKKVKNGFKPVLTKEEYLREWGRMK
jgi:amidohydrolase